MNVINCYALNHDGNEDDKYQFHKRLQSVVEKFLGKDLAILIRCLNTKVGMDTTGYEGIIGRHRLGKRNENSDRFASICAFNKMLMGRNMFSDKVIHKTIYVSPDHTTEKRIDHICSEKFGRSLEDVRTNRCSTSKSTVLIP